MACLRPYLAVVIAALLASSALALEPGLGMKSGPRTDMGTAPFKGTPRSLLSTCYAGEVSWINNCGNTNGACYLNGDCCCTGDVFTSPGGCNYCCSPGYVGCHLSDGSYGCFLSECPTVLTATVVG